MFAHAQLEKVGGFLLALRAEGTKHAGIDESLVRLIGGDLRLDVAILRRRPLIDPRLVLLHGGEFGRCQGVNHLDERVLVLLRHLLDGLDLTHPQKLAPFYRPRYAHTHCSCSGSSSTTARGLAGYPAFPRKSIRQRVASQTTLLTLVLLCY